MLRSFLVNCAFRVYLYPCFSVHTPSVFVDDGFRDIL